MPLDRPLRAIAAEALRLAAPLLLVPLLAATAAAQDALVGRAAADTARQPGATRYAVAADSVTDAVVDGLADLLRGRVPGVVVQQRSGALGAGADVRIRGRSTWLLDAGPAVFVDGVRVDDRQAPSALLHPWASPSALDDIAPEEIERIEVLPGSAAGWAYGPGAANGVILVTTRRAAAGEALRWRGFLEAGGVMDAGDYPSSTVGWYTAGDGSAQPGCTLVRQAGGSCTLDSLVTIPSLDDTGVLQTGPLASVGLSVSGALPVGALRASVRYADQEGVLSEESRQALALSAGWSGSPLPALDLHARIAYGSDELTSQDTPVGGLSLADPTVIVAGLLRRGIEDPGAFGYVPPFDTLLARAPRRDADRLMAGLDASWRALPWLDVAATAGVDRRDASEGYRLEQPVYGGGTPTGEIFTSILTSDARHTTYTLTASATARYGMRPSLRGATTLGVRHERVQSRVATLDSSGIGDLTGVTSTSTESPWRSLGILAEQRVVWREAVTMSAGVRLESFRRAVSLRNQDDAILPAASIVWALDREAFFPPSGALSALALRVAYGEATRPLSYLVGTGFEPERTRELEAGVDGAVMGERLRFGAAFYRQRTGNAIVPLGPSGVANAAVLRSTGVEGRLALALLRRRRWSWDVALQGATNRSIVDEANSVFLLPFEGHSVDARTYVPIESFQDTDGDGVIDGDEVVRGFLTAGGPDFPRHEAALSSEVTYGDWVTLGALLDYRGGFEQANWTRSLRCAFGVCPAAYDPTLPFAEQAEIVADVDGFSDSPRALEDGSFVRLRELSLALRLPGSLTQRLGASSAVLTLAGRNLALWTDYDGLDPEVRAVGAGDAGLGTARAGDFFVMPIPREIVVRLELGW